MRVSNGQNLVAGRWMLYENAPDIAVPVEPFREIRDQVRREPRRAFYPTLMQMREWAISDVLDGVYQRVGDIAVEQLALVIAVREVVSA